MKSTKTLLMAIILLIMSTSAFAKSHLNNTNTSKKVTHYILRRTSSYLVQLDITDLGVNGSYDGVYPLHNYSIYLYITDSATPGFANKLTIPSGGNLYVNSTLNITDDDPTYASSGLPVGSTILGGTNYSNLTTSGSSYFIAGAHLTITRTSATTTPSSFGGIPINVEFTSNYF